MSRIITEFKSGRALIVACLLLITGIYISLNISTHESSAETSSGAMLLSSTELVSYYSEAAPSMDEPNDPLWDYIKYTTGSIPLHAPTLSTQIYMSSIYTDTDMYLKINWSDVAENRDGVYWIYNNGNWTFNSPFQDGLSLIFSNKDPNNYFKKDGCMRSCHYKESEYLEPQNQQRHYTKTASETEDMWFWSASATDPFNYAVDGYINNIPSDNHVGYYLDPNEDFGLVKNRPLVDYIEYPYLAQPVFMQNPDMEPSIGGMWIKSGEDVPFDENYYDPDTGYANVNPVTHLPWRNGDTVAGYMLDHLPTGGDITAVSKYSQTTQTWTLVMKRSLTTSDKANDVQFDDFTKSYLFGISIFGDLSGIFTMKPGNVTRSSDTRCVPDKVTDTIALRFQPIYVAKNCGQEPLFNGFEITNATTLSTANAIISDPVWNGSQLYQESIYDLNYGELASINPCGYFDIRTIYTTENLYMRINWSYAFNRTAPRLEVGWQGFEPVSMSSKSWQFFAKGNHIHTNSPLGGDLWVVPLGQEHNISEAQDYTIGSSGAIADTGNGSKGVSVCYGDNNSLVIKRPLRNNDTNDIQFNDLTRVYTLSIMLYGVGPVEYVQTHLLSLRFEPNVSETSKPAAVQGLKASDGKDSNAILTWDVSTDADFGCYQVYYSNRTFTDVAGLKPLTKISEASRTTFEVKGLLPGQSHYFAVTAMDDNRNENKAAAGLKCTTTDIKSPAKVTGLAVTAGVDSDALLSWSASSASDFGRYAIYASRSDVTDASKLQAIANITDRGTTTFNVEGLLKTKTYYFAVAAVDLVGNMEKAVASVSTMINDITPPARISGLYAYDMAAYHGGSIGLEWNPAKAKDLSSYKVYMSKSPIDNITGLEPFKTLTEHNLTLTGLADLTRYYFIVTAEDWNGYVSLASVCVGVTPTRSGPPPPVVSFAGLDAKDGKVSLSWTPSTSPYFDHYCLYMSDQPITDLNSSRVSKLIDIADRDTGIYNLSGLQDGKTYYFAISVSNIHGNEDNANIVSTTVTPTATPPPPRNYMKEAVPYIILALLLVVFVVITVVVIVRIKKYGSIRTRRFGTPSKERQDRSGRPADGRKGGKRAAEKKGGPGAKKKETKDHGKEKMTPGKKGGRAGGK